MIRLSVVAMLLSGCSEGKVGEDADLALTSAIFIPDEGASLENPEIDESIQISGGASAGTTMAVNAGDQISVSIPFSAPNGNVVAAGIRFGVNGPIRTVQVPLAQGQQSGTLSFAFSVPPEICNDLSGICHDIKCYEFAVTSEGRVSRANINSIAMACGNCDEPSCQDLLDMCVAPPSLGVVCGAEAGGALQQCPNGQTLDYCIDTQSSRCWYEVGGQRIDCGSCQAIEGCAARAVDLCTN